MSERCSGNENRGSVRRMVSTDFDLVVIGGGPGGSTLSTLVALDGRRVLLLERERFPRYQIGESLLPITIHGICRMLGCQEEVERAGFQRKLGGSFRWGKNPEPWTFRFDGNREIEANSVGYAYQVERSRFDHILLENARRKGVDVRENCEVVDLIEEGGRVVGVRYRDEAGREHVVRSAWVADCGGNTSPFHQRVGKRVYSEFFRNVALFAYYEGAHRNPPPYDGNITCAAFDQGWFWYIPLSPTLTSVGAVIGQQHASAIKAEHGAAMDRFIAACPLIAGYLASARRVTEGIYGQYRIRKDYSYCNTRFWQPGLVLVGDAACFVDPVFSSGVHLSTYSALLAARSINSVLGDGLDEARCFEEFEQRYRREFGNFYEFLVGFYDMQQGEQDYFWKARSVIGSPEQANEAFVRLVAGASTSRDFFQEHEGLGAEFEQYWQQRDRSARGQASDEGPVVIDAMKRMSVEFGQIQAQAQNGAERVAEAPLFAGGLRPSRDGLRWSSP
jgi:FAD-dependent halogenase